MSRLLGPACAALALLPMLLRSFSASPQDPAPKPPASPPPAAKTAEAAPVKWTREHLQQLGDWMSGTWSLQEGKQTTEEHWRPLQGSTLLGTSHTFAGERTVFFEHLRITLQRDRIVYVAMPGGAAPTSFSLVTLTGGVAVFENAKHDYPQRIRYERTEKGITATISAIDGSKPQAFVLARQS